MKLPAIRYAGTAVKRIIPVQNCIKLSLMILSCWGVLIKNVLSTYLCSKIRILLAKFWIQFYHLRIKSCKVVLSTIVTCLALYLLNIHIFDQFDSFVVFHADMQRYRKFSLPVYYLMPMSTYIKKWATTTWGTYLKQPIHTIGRYF